MAYTAPKYPHILISMKRHEKLAKEAAKRNITITEVAEEKFKVAEKK